MDFMEGDVVVRIEFTSYQVNAEYRRNTGDQQNAGHLGGSKSDNAKVDTWARLIL